MTDNQPTASGVSDAEVEAATTELLAYAICTESSDAENKRLMRIAAYKALEAALSAKPAQGGDYVLVTDEMRKIGSQFVWSFDPNYAQTDRDPQGNSEGSGEWTAEATYRAMLAAAPPQPIPTPDEAGLKTLFQQTSAIPDMEAYLKATHGMVPFEWTIAAMSRVATLSRARPEEDKS